MKEYDGKLKLLLIKHLRIINHDTTESLSLKLNMHPRYIYEVENGKRGLSKEVFDEILKVYNHEYVTDNNAQDDAVKYINHLFKSYIEKDNDKFNELSNNYLIKYNLYIKTSAFIYLPVIERIVFINNYKRILNIDEYLKYYDNNTIYIATLMDIISNKTNYDYKQIRNDLESIYQKISLYKVDAFIQGLLFYCLGILYNLDNKTFEALKLLDKAKNMFEQCFSEEWVLNSKISIIRIISEQYNYTNAKENFEKIIEECDDKKYESQKYKCLKNMVGIYIIQNNFESLEKIFTQINTVKVKSLGITHYKLYFEYLHYDKEIVRKHLKDAIKYEDNKYIKYVLKMLHGFINENETNIDIYFEKAISYLNIHIDKIERRIILTMISNYYENRNIDKYIKYLKMINNL